MTTDRTNASELRFVELIDKSRLGLSKLEMSELRALFDARGFEAVSRVDEADDAPISGVATFLGVPYAFQRVPASSIFESFTPVDLCFELRPLDPRSGLTMRATAKFRLNPDAAPSAPPDAIANLQVKWNSFGAVGLNASPELRERFAEFLVGLANGTSTSALWNAFAVNHYRDELVENIRRECVELLLGRTFDIPCSDSERRQLHDWARRLCDPSSEPGGR